MFKPEASIKTSGIHSFIPGNHPIDGTRRVDVDAFVRSLPPLNSTLLPLSFFPSLYPTSTSTSTSITTTTSNQSEQA
jgi:hypothetical protein